MRRVLLGLCLLALFGVAELYVLLLLGEMLGAGATMAILAAAALVGVFVGRAQGLSVFRRWLDATAEGEEPEEGLVDGLLLLAGSALLILPGVLGDVIGLVLLLPPVRRNIADRLRRRAAGWVDAGNVQVLTARMGFDDEPAPYRDDGIEVIDVQGVVVEEKPERLLGP